MFSKNKLKILIGIVDGLCSLLVALFFIDLWIILTRLFTDELIKLPSIFIWGWLFGGGLIIVKVVRGCWSIIPSYYSRRCWK